MRDASRNEPVFMILLHGRDLIRENCRQRVCRERVSRKRRSGDWSGDFPVADQGGTQGGRSPHFTLPRIDLQEQDGRVGTGKSPLLPGAATF